MLTAEVSTAEKLFQTFQSIKDAQGKALYPIERCAQLIPLINAINRLKKKKDAVILAHTYAAPEIIYGVADYVGDSYALSKDATAAKARTIVFAAVRFMGETAKVLNPHKEVLVPARNGGCTLADAIDASTVRTLRRRFPDHAFACYINTSVAVKAECDICVTSGNINRVISRMPQKKVYFLPDKYMALNLIRHLREQGIHKKIEYFNGTCYAHEEFTMEEVQNVKIAHPQVRIAAHPECRPEVCAQADFIGSTAQILDYMSRNGHDIFMVLTEEGLGQRLLVEFPGKRIVGPQKTCRYMKSNSLEDIQRVLTNPADTDRITVDEDTRNRALTCLKAMFRTCEKTPED